MKKAGERKTKVGHQSPSEREPQTTGGANLPVCPVTSLPKKPRHALLVIGYGNTIRGDDGVGVKAATVVAKWNVPGVATLICHQLTPELAEPISEAERVIFVDASADSEKVELRQIKPDCTEEILAHSSDPSALLAMAKVFFDHCPHAYWLTIPIEDVSFGEKLSPCATRGLEVALEKIRLLAGGN
jgi:hydrogenase maturation protease